MKLYWSLLIGVCLAVSGLAAHAQQTSGEITGTVTDNTGAVIVGATVTATNTATQQVRSTTSNAAGNYVMPYLAPGTYNLVCSKQGFQAMRQQSIDVTVGAVLDISFAMQIGAVTSEITVTSAAPLLSTESTALQTNIGSRQIVSLPLNGRDYLSLVALTPNVENESAGGGGGGLMGGVRAQQAISVAGQRLEFNHYTLDGVENTDPDFNSYIIHPSVDALQEFTVLTGIYSAEFGRGASQINVTTRPGTNSYHGTAFEFLRNDYVDAHIWRQTGKKNPFKRNDYGFFLGGPLSIPHVFNAKNKLFFASSFEVDQDHELDRFVGSLPTQNMAAGDLSNYGIPKIYFPASRKATGACPVSSGGSYDPTTDTCIVSGTLNVIPSQYISPQAKAIMKVLYPTFPADTAAGYANDYETQSPLKIESTQFNQRIDWTQNSRSNWFGRFSWENDLDASATLIPQADSTFVGTTVRQAVIGNTFVVNQHMVNDARFAWDQFNNNYAGYYYGTTSDIPSQLGISGFTSVGGPTTNGVPAIGLSGGITGGGGQTPWITRDNLFQWIDDISYVKGNNSFKFGGMIERDRFNNFGNQKSVGEFDFDGASTNNPAIGSGTGFSFADFLFGTLSQYYRVAALPSAQLRRTIYAAYIQDDYKMRRNLTLNLGLRYDNTRPWVDKHDTIINMQWFQSGVNTTYTSPLPWVQPNSVLVPAAPTPILTRPGSGDFYQGIPFRYAEPQLVQRGNQYMGRSTVNASDFNYGPRVGINWAPGSNWSIRAGFGIYYMMDITNAVFDMVRNGGGKDGAVIGQNARTPGGVTNTLSSPWANEVGSPSCPGFSGVCQIAPQIQMNDQHNHTPYVEQYMFNVERQLSRNVAVDVGYMGNQGHHLMRDWIFNQAVPPSGPTDTSSVASRRPFPAYGNGQDMKDVGSSVYNAGDVKVTQRLSHGLQYMVALTWSHAIDFGSGVRPNGGDTLWPTNSYNMRAERGNSQFDMRRRLVGSFVYSLPFGAGQQFAPSNAVVNHIVSGWSMGGIITFADGTARNASTPLASPMGVLQNQPDATGQPYAPKNRNAAHYYNAAAFDYTNPALTYREGTMMRMTLTGPGSKIVDANISRTFHLWESHQLLFRVESFNLTNTVNWDAPGSSDTRSKTFGIITTASPMRELQGAIKYEF